MLNRFLSFLAVSATAAIGLTSPAEAQVINHQESATPYAQVRGWSVYIIGDGRGINSCRAVTGSGYDGQMMIDYGYHGAEAGWTLYVAANRTAADEGFGIRGAGVYFDNRLASDAQSGFGILGEDGASTSHAGISFVGLMPKFKSAGSMRISINGEASRTFSLHGSTAATLKVEECAQRNGLMASAAPAPRAAPAPSAPPAPPQTARIDGYTLGYVRFSAGQFRHLGNGAWVEEGDNGSLFNFQAYQVGSEAVFLNDASRNLQIWIDLPTGDILFTQNFDNNTWNPLYKVDCLAATQGRHC